MSGIDEITARSGIPIGGGLPIAGEAEARAAELIELLERLRDDLGAADVAAHRELATACANEPYETRMAIARGLFRGLQAKHVESAAHSLRVTLGCLAWSADAGLNNDQRDTLEIAALLHDVGKIAVPDSILLKPAPLSADEAATMNRCRRVGMRLVQHTLMVPGVGDIVGGATNPYVVECTAQDQVALPARMLSIMDAFDAMTSDHLYRSARTRDAALDELQRNAGTQFDPKLVEQFVKLDCCDPFKLQSRVARMLSLPPVSGDPAASVPHGRQDALGTVPTASFYEQLLQNMSDPVVFIDSNLRVAFWNRGAERLTGIARGDILRHRWYPGLVDMRSHEGAPLSEDDGLVAVVLRRRMQAQRRCMIRGRGGRPATVEMHAFPIIDGDGTLSGVAVHLRDTSFERQLEVHCEVLNEKLTKDPLTDVANRGEFDRVFDRLLQTGIEERMPCSLIICDIDRFKQVNDTYGHQAGDEVIKSFAGQLQNSCRPGDLVARYGGEEFVLLCPGCDGPAAAERADAIRRTFAASPQRALNGKMPTASFGVTELWPGDSTATMLGRADEALYEAKNSGRNTVVLNERRLETKDDTAGASSGVDGAGPALADVKLVSRVPLGIALEKLRGFVVDHDATIDATNGQHVRISIGGRWATMLRRRSDYTVPLLLDVYLDERWNESPTDVNSTPNRGARTLIHLTVFATSTRSRRLNDAKQQVRQLLSNFRAYMMAADCAGDDESFEPADG